MADGSISMNETLGIDVSHFQGDIDWCAVAKAGVGFAYLKATQGLAFVDPKFAYNRREGRKADIRLGAYHFFEPDQDPAGQVDHFLAALDKTSLDLPAALDIEISGQASPQGLTESIETWLQRVENALSRRPLIYTNPSFWRESVASSDFGQYPLWIAEYGVQEPALPQGWSDWTLWQHSQNGQVDGIRGPVDLDRLNGPLSSFP